VSISTFINLPVSDLPAATAFFTRLGFSFNADFSNDDAGYMIVNDNTAVLLVTEPFFETITGTKIADQATSEVALALQVDSREEVDRMVDEARSAGAADPVVQDAEEDFMYSRGFRDLDGHLWNVLHMITPS
jgi:hypothetical protein